MTVAISYNKGVGKYYDIATGSSSISFSSLRINFKEVSLGPVKASELLRNLSNTETNPIVPDATENSTISSSTQNWKVSQFYGGKIKYYDIIQSGTDDNVSNAANHGIDVSAQSWNSNLNKNVKKVFYVDGTLGSISVTRYAAYFNAEAYNFQIELRSGGQILGAGGARNSGVGGNALYANSSGSGVASQVSIVLNDNSTIRGGGGGGARGADGWTGPNGPCWISREYQVAGGCEWCSECGNPNTSVKINGTTYNSRNYLTLSGCPGERGCSCAFGWYNGILCTKTKLGNRSCSVDDPSDTDGAPGGIGGNGGLGQGYTQTRTNAISTLNETNGPTSGTLANCPTYANTGEDGKVGGNGADWAGTGGGTIRTDIAAMQNAFYVSPSSGYNGSAGGDPGRAITGSNYTYSGRTDLILGAK